jgi:hypothetical protein
MPVAARLTLGSNLGAAHVRLRLTVRPREGSAAATAAAKKLAAKRAAKKRHAEATAGEAVATKKQRRRSDAGHPTTARTLPVAAHLQTTPSSRLSLACRMHDEVMAGMGERRPQARTVDDFVAAARRASR